MQQHARLVLIKLPAAQHIAQVRPLCLQLVADFALNTYLKKNMVMQGSYSSHMYACSCAGPPPTHTKHRTKPYVLLYQLT